MIRSIVALLAAVTALVRPLAAQADRWQLTLDDDQYVWDIRLLRLDGDSLVVRQSDSLVRVAIARIKEIRLIRKSEMAANDAGTTAGAMSALVGGNDEIYDLATLDFAERLQTVRKILLLHPTEP